MQKGDRLRFYILCRLISCAGVWFIKLSD